MKIALIALASLLPALASADEPKPFVVYQGRAVRPGQAAPPAVAAQAAGSPQGNTEAVRQVSAFGTGSIRAGVSGGRSFARPASSSSRAIRGASSRRRGIVGSTPLGTPPPAPTDSAPPAYAVSGAKILSEGQQPVYSEAKGGGTHSVEGGGFIAMDESRARDVGRAPGISWAPPDTPPSASRVNSGGGGSGASANGPATPSAPPSNVPPTAPDEHHRDDGATGFNPSF